jgi:predicted amino acid-binding ACT domain protein
VTQESYSAIVRRLVDADPALQECLARGIVNYTEVARRLAPLVEKETGEAPSIEAVKIALIRYASKLSQSPPPTPKRRLLEILAKSTLELRTGVTVATVRLPYLPRLAEAAGRLVGKARLFFFMQSLTSITVTVSQDTFEVLRNAVGDEGFIKIYRDQAVLVIVSPEDVIRVPGFIGYITGMMARNGVNISQIESVHTDTILVMDLEDALKAFKLLREAIEQAKRSLGL